MMDFLLTVRHTFGDTTKKVKKGTPSKPLLRALGHLSKARHIFASRADLQYYVALIKTHPHLLSCQNNPEAHREY